MLKTDWVEIRPILESLMPHITLLAKPTAMVQAFDSESKQLRTYYSSVMNCAFDKLTRALWPSVSYWTLTDWMCSKVETLEFDFHERRFEAMTREFS
jgi:hypothetical protein